MKKLPQEWSDWFAEMGLGRRSLLKMRFGGVVGKMALVAIFFLAVPVVVAFKAEGPMMLWGCLGAASVVALSTIGLMARHANRHPLEATMEGGEVVAMHHIQAMAAKGMKEIPESVPMLEGIGKKPPEDVK